MAIVRKRPTLKVRKGIPAGVKAQRPQCEVHGVEMRFDPEEMGWKCIYATCMASRGRAAQIDYDAPILGRGDIELLVHVDEDGKYTYILRCEGNNVHIDVTPYLACLPSHRDTDTEVEIDLNFTKVSVVNNYKKKGAPPWDV